MSDTQELYDVRKALALHAELCERAPEESNDAGIIEPLECHESDKPHDEWCVPCLQQSKAFLLQAQRDRAQRELRERLAEADDEYRQLLEACGAVLNLECALDILGGTELDHLQDLIAKACAKR